MTSEISDEFVETETGVDNDNQGETVEAEPSPVDDADDDAKTYDAKYVKRLREEAQRFRQKANDADAELGELRSYRLGHVLQETLGNVLSDPTDVLAFTPEADLTTNGKPDPEKIMAAATELAAKRPHLRQSVGSVDGGARAGVTSSSGLETLTEKLRR
jgi:hypothetical protein